ncbi:MAG: hypothetical protein RH860_12590 [Cytophagales bacterium]
MNNSVFVVIRSVGELTTDVCLEKIRTQIEDNSIAVIKEKPFSNAVKKTFELGIKSGKKWTLAVDADILLTESSISDLINQAEQLPDEFFMIQGRVLDKLFGFARNGGPHLFRTGLCDKALMMIPDSKNEIRPEGATVNAMIDKGYHRYKGKDVYGIHDFNQSNFDIFRKAYAYGLKFRDMAPYFLGEWAKKRKFDPQFDIAICAFSLALGRNKTSQVDESYLHEIFEKIDYNDLKNSVNNHIESVSDFISKYKISPRAYSEHKKHNSILRSDKNDKIKNPSRFKRRILKKVENWIQKRQ